MSTQQSLEAGEGAVAWADGLVSWPDPHSGDRIVGFRIPEGDPRIADHYGLNWLRSLAPPAARRGCGDAEGFAPVACARCHTVVSDVSSLVLCCSACSPHLSKDWVPAATPAPTAADFAEIAANIASKQERLPADMERVLAKNLGDFLDDAPAKEPK